MEHYDNYINGAWIPAFDGRLIESENPYTRQPWATIARSGMADVHAAVNAAVQAFESGSWGTMTSTERGKLLWRMGDLLEANADRLAKLETSDNGRAIVDVTNAVVYLSEFFRYYGGLADKIEGAVPPLEKQDFFNFTQHEPYGVVAAIIPWNAPLLLLIWKLAPGLAAGNTFVIKPHESASVASLELAALFMEAGFPSGVVNVITGTGPEVGEPLVGHAGISKVAFTGGGKAGEAVYKAAAAGFKPVTLELGGKSPALVFEDADLEKAAINLVMGLFTASGQACVSCSRILIQEGVYDKFVELLIKHVSTARLGDPADPETDIGPMGGQSQYDNAMKYLDLARQEGASVLLGGEASARPGCDNGYFIEPTILGEVTNTMQIAREEIFGPVMCCIRFKDEEEAVKIANDTRYGLGACIFTENLRHGIRISKQIQAGIVYINTYRQVSYMSPFGGYKQSGVGRENGLEAIREYMQTKSVWISLSEETPQAFGKPYG